MSERACVSARDSARLRLLDMVRLAYAWGELSTTSKHPVVGVTAHATVKTLHCKKVITLQFLFVLVRCAQGIDCKHPQQVASRWRILLLLLLGESFVDESLTLELMEFYKHLHALSSFYPRLSKFFFACKIFCLHSAYQQ